MMRGVVLAGGTGSRLWPATKAVSKQLLPIFDKPMVYYPLTTLVNAGIRDIMIVTAAEEWSRFHGLLGDGSQWGLRLEYAVQHRPDGIAQALLIAEDFLAGGPVALILGDNLFHGSQMDLLPLGGPLRGAQIFAYPVVDPTAYGVVEFDHRHRVISIEEKPFEAKSRYAVPGLYLYDGEVVEIARQLRPSARGELEITAVNQEYLRRGELTVTVLDRSAVWLDTGTFGDLVKAGEYVRVIEERQGLKIGCIEEASWRPGFISDRQLTALAEPLRRSGYGDYLLRLVTWASSPAPRAAAASP